MKKLLLVSLILFVMMSISSAIAQETSTAMFEPGEYTIPAQTEVYALMPSGHLYSAITNTTMVVRKFTQQPDAKLKAEIINSIGAAWADVVVVRYDEAGESPLVLLVHGKDLKPIVSNR